MADDLIPALLCHKIYYDPKSFDKIIDNGSVYAGYALINGRHTLTLRGSYTDGDWWHDLESVTTMQHPFLGLVGRGFVDGVDDGYPRIRVEIPAEKGTTIYIYAHSLGCTHAFYLAAYFIRDGFNVEIVALEPPRACGRTLIDMLAPYPVRCYRNEKDFVTQVPPELDHPREIIPLNCDPVSGDVSPFRFHHTALLVTAFALKQNGTVCN